MLTLRALTLVAVVGGVSVPLAHSSFGDSDTTVI